MPATPGPPGEGRPAPPPVAPAPSKPGEPPKSPPQQNPAPGAPPLPAAGGADGVAPPAGAGPFPSNLAAMSRSVRRTKGNNTRALMEGVKALEEMGLSSDEAIRVGMGRFPVGGHASYTHDWWLPRFGPGWRLHQGTDIFAVQGTPVRAPGDGVVRFTNGGLGGISTYVIQDDGTYFYMTHLSGRPKTLHDGARVRTGDAVGFVGATGNAAGGSPHLHFEIHPAPVKVVTKGKGKNRTTQVIPLKVKPGTTLPPVDPKPHLDAFLREAVAELPGVVEAHQAAAGLPDGFSATPGEIAAPAVAVGALSAVELHQISPLVAQRFTRAPLIAFAFVLLVVVASLTPVVRQVYRGSLPVAAAAATGAAAAASAGVGGLAPVSVATSSQETPSPAPAKRHRRRRRRSARRGTDAHGGGAVAGDAGATAGGGGPGGAGAGGDGAGGDGAGGGGASGGDDDGSGHHRVAVRRRVRPLRRT